MMERLILEFFGRPRATVLLSAIVFSAVLTGSVFADGANYGP